MEQTIDWKPFSAKHKRYIHNALKNKMSVAEGAIRSGKTIDNCIIAAAFIETCPDKIHLATGSTIGNAKLNVGDCNGYGLEYLFRGRCRWGKYKSNEALYIRTKTGDKVVLFAGGGKADSYRHILGNSYGLWIATEINEHYDSEDSKTSFIKVAFGRQLAAKQPMILWDLNPCHPHHSIYTDYIDAYMGGRYVGGYNYEHFTIRDNLSISEERRQEIESQYDHDSIWYRRDILGERCVSEGVIYPNYENAVELPPKSAHFSGFVLSVDYGTLNAFAGLLWAKFGDVWYCVAEYYYSGRDNMAQKSDPEYADDIRAFLDEQGEKWGVKLAQRDKPLRMIVDPSAASFITLMRKTGGFSVMGADNDVLNGIRETTTAMRNGRIKISPECKNLISEMQGYVWDDRSEIDKPVKIRDHACDALRYFVKTMRVAVQETTYHSIFGG